MQEKKDNSALRNRIFTIVGIVLCVILIPILIINCSLLVKGWVKPDEVPSIFNISPMIVKSDSMDPDFPKGSMIFVKKVDPTTVKPQDIISYFDPEMGENAVTTHKVWKIENDENGKPAFFYTYGTTLVEQFAHKNPDEIAITDCEKIPVDDFIGVYTGVYFGGLGDFAFFMQTTPGLIVCVALPLILLVGYDILRRKLYEKKHAPDKDQLMKELEELRRLKMEQEGNTSEEVGDMSEEVGVEETPAEAPPAEEKPADEK